jgi:parallel beta-helix repeat protein
VIRGNRFAEDPAGVRLHHCRACRIEGNRFDAISWDGVVLDGSNRNRVVGNRFLDGRLTGLQLRGSSGNEIAGNEFSGQKAESILIDRDARDNRIRGNSFHDNRGMAVSNETPHPVDATGNWWGSPQGPRPAVDVDTNVRVRPWLTEPVELALG